MNCLLILLFLFFLICFRLPMLLCSLQNNTHDLVPGSSQAYNNMYRGFDGTRRSLSVVWLPVAVQIQIQDISCKPFSST